MAAAVVILAVVAVVLLAALLIRRNRKQKAVRMEAMRVAGAELVRLLPFMQNRKEQMREIRKHPFVRVEESLYGEEEAALLRNAVSAGAALLSGQEIQALADYGKQMEELEAARLEVCACTDEQLMQTGSPLTVFNDRLKSVLRSMEPASGAGSLAELMEKMAGL